MVCREQADIEGLRQAQVVEKFNGPVRERRRVPARLEPQLRQPPGRAAGAIAEADERVGVGQRAPVQEPAAAIAVVVVGAELGVNRDHRLALVAV